MDDIAKTPKVNTLALALTAQRYEEQKGESWQEILAALDWRAVIGRKCLIYWPMDDYWYPGVIFDYNRATKKHKLLYEGNENEWVDLTRERFKLGLKDVDDCLPNEVNDVPKPTKFLSKKTIEVGDVVWNKVRGFPHWPALVLNVDSNAENLSSEDIVPLCNTTPLTIQFFGTFDCKISSVKSCPSFMEGLKAGYDRKCKQASFLAGLEQVRRYLTEDVMPEQMALNFSTSEVVKETIEASAKCLLPPFPWQIRGLKVLSLGKIVTDSSAFHSDKHIWPAGFKATRFFASSKKVTEVVEHDMEILPSPSGPLFRITPADGSPVESADPAESWALIASRTKRAQQRYAEKKDVPLSSLPSTRLPGSAPVLFGFAVRAVQAAIQSLPNAKLCLKLKEWLPPLKPGDMAGLVAAPVKADKHHDVGSAEKCRDFKAVEYSRDQTDVCSVCCLSLEFDHNLLLQCDSCRILVHMECYGVQEPPDGDLWLCDHCDERAADAGKEPQCCLCPVQGGAVKRTEAGRWAHIACAIWIPETCFEETGLIRGAESISKARLKLRCTLCRVSYGACIQCARAGCCAAYHPLCARSAGLQMEMKELTAEQAKVESKKRGRNMQGSVQGIVQLLSFCPKHSHSKQSGASPGNGPARKGKSKGATDSAPPADPPPLPGAPMDPQLIPCSGSGPDPANVEADPDGRSLPSAGEAVPAQAAAETDHEEKAATVAEAGELAEVNGGWLAREGCNASGCARTEEFASARKRSREAAETERAATLYSVTGRRETPLSRQGQFAVNNAPLPLPASLRHPSSEQVMWEHHWGTVSTDCLPDLPCLPHNATALDVALHLTARPHLLSTTVSAHAAAAASSTPLQTWSESSSSCTEQSIAVPDSTVAPAAPPAVPAPPADAQEPEIAATPAAQLQQGSQRESTHSTVTVVETCFGRSRKQGADSGVPSVQAGSGNGSVPVPGAALSMSDRFRRMQSTVSSRLAMGKSSIHGWGLFAKEEHAAGDMVIEYAGEVVRPAVADIREKRCYNTFVGAGTYMFRIDEQRVVDATRTGSIAHLINHSCQPNCYSRVVRAGKEDRIIIFAKRGIHVSEELCYDYRFNSKDEQLVCNCGAQNCRGFVNEETEQEAICVPTSQLKFL